MEGSTQEEMKAAYLAATAGRKEKTHKGYTRQKPRRDRQDADFSYGGDTQEMPMPIRNFLEDLKTAISERQVDVLDEMYSKEYNKLGDQLVKNMNRNQGPQGKGPQGGKWPLLEDAKQFLGDDHFVHTLYKELYYRHIFAKFAMNVTVQDRITHLTKICFSDQFQLVCLTDMGLNLNLKL